MNQIAEEYGVAKIDDEVENKKKKKKKDKSQMSESELKSEKAKNKYKKIYDCLMFQQCMIQYNKYGSYIAFENQYAKYDLRLGQVYAFYILFSICIGYLGNKW